MKTRIGTVVAVLALVAALAATATADNYEILIVNEIPGGLETGQPFSPPVCAVHNTDFALFTPGELASPGLILVAEEGNPSMLQMEAEASADVSAVVVGTGPFFDPQSIMIEGEPGDLFSCAWMLGRTNDLFTGLHDVELPASGSIEFTTTVWDAGSEVNTGMIEDLGFYGNPNTGPDEENPIMAIDSYTIFNDPDYGELSWEFPPSSTVTIIYQGPTPNEELSWDEVKRLYR
jgi:hypothetical protein